MKQLFRRLLIATIATGAMLGLLVILLMVIILPFAGLAKLLVWLGTKF